MKFFMDILRGIESIRTPILDSLFSLVTHIGEETFFLVIAIVFFWCVNKREGYFILITGLLGTVINQASKLIFRIPRPWVIDPEFTIVESARAEAGGYSFPSGHTQNAAGTFGTIAAYNKNKRPVVISCVAVALLVGFSRMYLGVHTLLDVGVAILTALILILVLRPVFSSDESFDKFMPITVFASVTISLAYFIYVMVIRGDATLDPHNLASGVKNACTLLGCTIALVPVYYLDKKYIKFETAAPWYAQILKLVIGLGGVLLIKSGLSTPLTLLFGNEYVARVVRYFLVVLFAGSVWPLTFAWFSGLKVGALDNFGVKIKSLFVKK